tara:strand:+ start:1625 stop:1816 length:192 start_codon:yes stop_codon:yes gene_type:complete
MSNFEDLPKIRPIIRVEDNLHSLRKILNQIKLDISDIKSELDLIKTLIKENHNEPISNGWFSF